MAKNKLKKAFILFTTYFTILLTAKATTVGESELFPYNDSPKSTVSPYSTYSSGDIYISDEETIKRIIVDSCDVYIIDERDNVRDPNMCICNSYKIRSTSQIYEIIDILLQYESENPSEWDRTRQSLFNEWVMHNLGYDFGIKRYRTGNVDLNNNDEDKYDNPTLNLLLK